MSSPKKNPIRAKVFFRFSGHGNLMETRIEVIPINKEPSPHQYKMVSEDSLRIMDFRFSPF